MRCKNCGWPIQPGETQCAKCGAPVDSPSGGNGYDNYAPQPAAQNLKKTVLEASALSDAVYPQPAGPVPPTVQGASSCPQCGFPLRQGASKCPKCGAAVSGGQPDYASPLKKTVLSQPEMPAQPVQQPVAPVQPEQNDVKSEKGGAFKNFGMGGATVNPYLDGFDLVPVGVLSPVKRSNERKELQNVEIEGDELMLKRGNTDPDNPTISTEHQALVTREGDNWYIVDKSETRTTFVQAKDKMSIKEGSIILLGNRLFEFHIQ